MNYSTHTIKTILVSLLASLILLVGILYLSASRFTLPLLVIVAVILITAVISYTFSLQTQQKSRPNDQEKIQILQKENAQLQKQIEALLSREADAQQFQKKLQTLHRVSIKLARLTDETELYKKAIEYGRFQLGFDRLAILRFDEQKEWTLGTYGTDDQGQIVDETDFRSPIENWELRHIYEEQKRAILLENGPLYTKGIEVGFGWNAITVIWGKGESIGWLVTDNLIQKKEPNPFQLEILSLYGANLGQIIAQRNSEAILRESEANARQFQDKLQTLHKIGLKLSQTDTLKELYHQAIDLGVHQLGYERLALLLYDPRSKDMIGTFGTNHLGEIVDETGFRQHLDPSFSLASLLTDQKRLSVRESTTLYTDGQPAGEGWRATSVLWNGHEGIGWLSIDNLLTRQPIKPHQLEILYLYGATLGNLITAKRNELAIQSYATELERSNHDLQDFAYAASHDLQEPLRKIQTFSGRLQTRYAATLDTRGNDYLNRMQDAASRMQTLIEDLLAYSRVNTHKQPFAVISLQKIMQGVLSDLETRIEDTKATINVHDLPEIEADATQMRQLLQNLVGNALKFHRADVPPIIEVWGEDVTTNSKPDKMCRVYVTDNGIGIEEQFAERIFGVFQRLHGRNEYEGSGVGLAVCRRICERHQGSIKVESKPNAGSTFIIELPLRQPPERA